MQSLMGVFLFPQSPSIFQPLWCHWPPEAGMAAPTPNPGAFRLTNTFIIALEWQLKAIDWKPKQWRAHCWLTHWCGKYSPFHQCKWIALWPSHLTPISYRAAEILKHLGETWRFALKLTLPIQAAGRREERVSERKIVQRLYRPRLAEDELGDFSRKGVLEQETAGKMKAWREKQEAWKTWVKPLSG